MSFSVLIADDQKIVRSVLRLCVEAQDVLNVCPDEAENGHEAIELVRRQTPDAVILDCEMPEMDGLEALPAIRAALPEGVLVMYSSDESSEMPTAATSAGADAYLCKGERTPAEVVALVAETLSSRRTA